MMLKSAIHVIQIPGSKMLILVNVKLDFMMMENLYPVKDAIVNAKLAQLIQQLKCNNVFHVLMAI